MGAGEEIPFLRLRAPFQEEDLERGLQDWDGVDSEGGWGRPHLHWPYRPLGGLL